jgi:hypothetical protein
MSWAEVYHYAADCEVFLDAENVAALRATLVGEAADVASDSLELLFADVHDWSSTQRARLAEMMERTTETGATEAVSHAILMYSAPLGCALGACLQGMSAPGVFEDDVQLCLLSLLADDVGVGRAGASRADAFELLCRRVGLPTQPDCALGWPSRPDGDDAAFALPALLMAMSRRSDYFGLQLCAADLVMRTVGLMPFWAVLRSRYPDSVDWSRLDLAMAGQPAVVADPLASSRAVVARLCAVGPEAIRSVARAARWTFDALAQLHEWVFARASAALDPHARMAQLIRNRAQDASVYHHGYELGGCPLARHFATAVEDAEPLMKLLSESRLIRPGQSSSSVLVNGLVGPHGKMFRVFRESELATIRQWIDALPQQRQRQAGAATPAPAPPIGIRAGNMHVGERPRDIRHAYHVLQGRALGPQTRRFAVDYVNCWMQHSASMPDTAQSLPTTWPDGGLRPWLSAQHALSSRAFHKADPSASPTREEITDSTLQLAPLICIDGAWLQGFTDIRLAASTVGHSLFETYWDELGNGKMALNHPKIYRDLLCQMQFELAPTGSSELANDPRLHEGSFRLPVLWLCLGKLPLTFLPEILGMNLAMELSGVGGGYRHASKFLRHYGFSTHFVDLHNTIDNVASGHSAWAADALDAHLRTAARTLDAVGLEKLWQRVLAGYKSMTAVPPKVDEWLARLYAPASQAQRTGVVAALPTLFHHH